MILFNGSYTSRVRLNLFFVTVHETCSTPEASFLARIPHPERSPSKYGENQDGSLNHNPSFSLPLTKPIAAHRSQIGQAVLTSPGGKALVEENQSTPMNKPLSVRVWEPRARSDRAALQKFRRRSQLAADPRLRWAASSGNLLLQQPHPHRLHPCLEAALGIKFLQHY